MHELAMLQPGALLQTGLEPDAELELYVVGQKRFRAAAGRVGRNLAARVLDRARPDPEYLIAAGRDTPPVV
jgi:flagellar motor switch protein FliM